MLTTYFKRPATVAAYQDLAAQPATQRGNDGVAGHG